MNFIISEIKLGVCPECKHCHGDADISEFLKAREVLREKVIQEAKDFFGSVDRDSTADLIDATGKLLIHEHCQDK